MGSRPRSRELQVFASIHTRGHYVRDALNVSYSTNSRPKCTSMNAQPNVILPLPLTLPLMGGSLPGCGSASLRALFAPDGGRRHPPGCRTPLAFILGRLPDCRSDVNRPSDLRSRDRAGCRARDRHVVCQGVGAAGLKRGVGARYHPAFFAAASGTARRR